MMMKHLNLVLTLLVFAAPALKADRCAYASFQPGRVLEQLVNSAQEAGVAIVQADAAPGGLTPGRAHLAKNGALVGQLLFEQNVAKGSSVLTVFHPKDSSILYQVSESTSVCPPRFPTGQCRRIEAWTSEQPPTGQHFPFLLTAGPQNAYPEFFRYTSSVSYSTFMREFRETFGWLMNVLVTLPDPVVPELRTPRERMAWALATDPAVAPYVNGIRYFTTGSHGGVVEVHGRVPSNYVYGRVIDALRSAGFYRVNPKMIIDGRMDRPTGLRDIPGCPIPRP